MRNLFYNAIEQAKRENERTKLWMPVMFATGIGIYFLISLEPSKWLTLGIIEALIGAAIVFRHRPQILSILKPFSLIVFGFAWVQVNTIDIASKQATILSGKHYIQGSIQKIDYNYSGKLRLTLSDLYDFDNNKLLGSYRISLRNKNGNYKVGQCVELIANIMPKSEVQIHNGTQFGRNLFYKKITGNGYAESRALITECVKPPSVWQKLHSYIANKRSLVVQKIYSVLSPDEASIVSAILVGEQSLIKQSIIQNYRNSGLAHFLSISGLHMSMIVGLMFFFIRQILAFIPSLSLRYDTKKISAITAIIISLLYLMISGMAVPAERAFIMTFIVLLGVLLDRRAISMYTIAWAGFIILFIRPDALVSASFQMSFAAVVALIAFYEKFASKIANWFNSSNDNLAVKSIKILCCYLIGIIVADFVASLATLPFAIYHFNRIAIYTSLTNLIAGPIIGFIVMPFTLLSLLTIPLGLETYFLHIVGWGVGLLNDLTSQISSFNGASMQIQSMPLWGLLLITFGGLWLCIWQQKWRLWGLAGIIIGCLSFFSISKPDILINEDNSLVAIKDEQNNMVVLPTHGKNFTRKIWLEKTASHSLSSSQKTLLKKIWQGKTAASKWLDMQCDEKLCIYKKIVKIGKDKTITINDSIIDVSTTKGAAVYLYPKIKIQGFDSSAKNRPWK